MLKWVLFLPTRFCLKIIGPLESSFIAKHKSNKTGDNTTIPINDKIKSMIRFNPSLYNKTHSYLFEAFANFTISLANVALSLGSASTK